MVNTFEDLLRASLMQIHPDEQKTIEKFMRIITKDHPHQMTSKIPEPYYSLLLDIFVAAHKAPGFKDSADNVMVVLKKFEDDHGIISNAEKTRIMNMAANIFKSFQPLDQLIIEKSRLKSGPPDAGLPMIDANKYDEEQHGTARGLCTFVPGIGAVKVSNQN